LSSTTWTALSAATSRSTVLKADKFLMAMALHAAPDDLAFEDVEGGEQGGRL
jgi:hypothetical protein